MKEPPRITYIKIGDEIFARVSNEWYKSKIDGKKTIYLKEVIVSVDQKPKGEDQVKKNGLQQSNSQGVQEIGYRATYFKGTNSVFYMAFKKNNRVDRNQEKKLDIKTARGV